MDDSGRVKSEIDLSAVRYDTATGLVPVVVQDVASKDVLMVAYANREALKRTFATGQTWFWSRSRGAYWHKGETSGNVQHVVDIRVDCDGDTVLYVVRPVGPACHTGETTCFYRRLTYTETAAYHAQNADESPSPESGATSSDEAYDRALARGKVDSGSDSELTVADWARLQKLWQTVDNRYRNRPQGSYSSYLFDHGAEKIGKKVGEEATEVALSALRAELTGHCNTVASESADLLYHLFVLWRSVNISPNEVLAVLQSRES